MHLYNVQCTAYNILRTAYGVRRTAYSIPRDRRLAKKTRSRCTVADYFAPLLKQADAGANGLAKQTSANAEKGTGGKKLAEEKKNKKFKTERR